MSDFYNKLAQRTMTEWFQFCFGAFNSEGIVEANESDLLELEARHAADLKKAQSDGYLAGRLAGIREVYKAEGLEHLLGEEYLGVDKSEEFLNSLVTANELTVTRYEYKAADDLGIFIEFRGSGWAIVRSSYSWVMGKTTRWTHEPLPSSRDEAYFAEYRFDSVNEAIARLKELGI